MRWVVMYKNGSVKKYAMMLMNEDFTSQDTQLNIPGIEHHIFTVCSADQAIELAKKLTKEGFGAIEVCGAFGEEHAKLMHHATGEMIPVGYVKYPKEQERSLQIFWES